MIYLHSIILRRELFPTQAGYPFSLPAYRGLDEIPLTSSVTFFVGENGSGKSTLLEAVAYQCGFHTAGGGRHNLYHVDRAEAALSPMRQLAFLYLMRELVEEGAQFLIATHSPILMGFPGARILSFDESPLAEVRYEETEHYQLTRRFLENPRAFWDI
jgi:predicted ATPase